MDRNLDRRTTLGKYVHIEKKRVKPRVFSLWGANRVVSCKLTDMEVSKAKPREKVYRLGDGDGLHLEILPTGGKYWHLRYLLNGKEHKISLGVYPHITLAEAREKRNDFKRSLAHGIDPRASKPEVSTFEKVARDWCGRKIAPSKSEQYCYKVMSQLEKYLFPHIGNRPINEIVAPEILAPLRAIESQGKNETAHAVRQIAGQVFRYGVATGACDRDPAADLKGALASVVTKHRAAITDPRKVKDLILAMTAFSGSPVVKAALWFSAYTFQRPGEIRHAEWTEIDFDAALWRIPDPKMKEREPHLVPLSRQAVDVLQGIKPLTGHGKYIFPTIRSIARGNVPMSENTITAALRRLGFGQDEMSAHGFRGMASTILNEQGWPPDVIERALAHAEGNSVRAAYNHARHLPERRKMIQAWADWLDGLKEWNSLLNERI
jgi:integrase